MATKQVEAFYQKVAEDKNLKGQLEAIKGNSDEVYGKVAKVAQDAGFDVSSEDIRSFFAAQKLSDESLEYVAGGYSDCTSVCGEVCGMFLGHYVGRQ